MDENAEIFIFERTGDVSFANCGLPYYVGGAIAERRQLLVATPERFRDFFNIEVRTRHEVRRIDRQEQTIEVQNVQTGAVWVERYDALVLAPGAAPCGRRCRASTCPASSPCATWTTSTRSMRGSAVARSIARWWSGRATSAWRWSKTSAGAASPSRCWSLPIR